MLVKWVPHKLTKNLIYQYPSGNRNKIDPFLKLIVIGDGKWVTYNNVKLK